MRGFVGKISAIHKNTKIGFTQESDRETKYDILFEDIPEHLIKPIEDGNNRGNPKVPENKTEEPERG